MSVNKNVTMSAGSSAIDALLIATVHRNCSIPAHCYNRIALAQWRVIRRGEERTGEVIDERTIDLGSGFPGQPLWVSTHRSPRALHGRSIWEPEHIDQIANSLGRRLGRPEADDLHPMAFKHAQGEGTETCVQRVKLARYHPVVSKFVDHRCS